MPTRESFSVRRAQPEDVAAVHQIHTEAIRAGASEHYSPEVLDVWVDAFNPESFPTNIQRMEFFVAEAGTREATTGPSAHSAIPSHPPVVGFLAFDLKTAELDSLYVAPWGTGMGVGGHLLAFAEGAAKDAGLSSVWLDASLNAVSFYERHGWVPVKEHARVRKGVEIPVVKMEKSLTG